MKTKQATQEIIDFIRTIEYAPGQALDNVVRVYNEKDIEDELKKSKFSPVIGVAYSGRFSIQATEGNTNKTRAYAGLWTVLYVGLSDCASPFPSDDDDDITLDILDAVAKNLPGYEVPESGRRRLALRREDPIGLISGRPAWLQAYEMPLSLAPPRR